MSATAARISPSAPLHHVRFSQLQSDQGVEHGDEAHRYDEEQEGGQLERVLQQDPLHCAHHHFRMRLVLHQAKLQGLGQGERQGNQPHDQDQFHRPGQLGHGLRQKRVTDGQVSLDSERRDGEDRGVRRCFGGQPSKNAETLAEDVGILAPHHVDLRREAGGEQQQVWHGQAEQIIVGRRVHWLVARDHYARAYVPDYPSNEDGHVDDGHRDHDVQRVSVRDRVEGYFVVRVVRVQGGEVLKVVAKDEGEGEVGYVWEDGC